MRPRTTSARFSLIVSWINPHDIYRIKGLPPLDPDKRAEVRVPANLDDDLSLKPEPQRIYLAEDQGKPFRNDGPEDWRDYIAFYQQLTEQVDAEIGSVVHRLHERGGNPLIVFSSDHGDLGGAHGLPFKGPAMYEELIRVPLLISWPGRIPPGTCDALVSTIDILPTLCDLADIAPPDGIDGRSLRPWLENPDRPTGRDVLFAEYHGKQNWRVPIRMVRSKTWKYVRYRRYGEELYHLEIDPGELKNLANDPRFAAVKKDLSVQLDRWIERTEDPFPQLTVTDRRGKEIEQREAQGRR